MSQFEHGWQQCLPPFSERTTSMDIMRDFHFSQQFLRLTLPESWLGQGPHAPLFLDDRDQQMKSNLNKLWHRLLRPSWYPGIFRADCPSHQIKTYTHAKNERKLKRNPHTHTLTHTHTLSYTHNRDFPGGMPLPSNQNIHTHTPNERKLKRNPHTHSYTHSLSYTHIHSYTHTHTHALSPADTEFDGVVYFFVLA